VSNNSQVLDISEDVAAPAQPCVTIHELLTEWDVRPLLPICGF